MKKSFFKIFLYITVFLVCLELMAYASDLKSTVSIFLMKKKPNTTFQSLMSKDDLGSKGIPYGVWDANKLNKFGFNDSDDYDFTPEGESVRIMCIGDSVTFGTSTWPVSWPGLLEEKLKSRGLDAEVINASFPGNSLPQIISRFEKEHIKFRPKYLLFIKEFRYYMAGAGTIECKEPYWYRIATKSHFVDKFMSKNSPDPLKRLRKRRLAVGDKNMIHKIRQEDIDSYRKDLDRLAKICSDNSISLIVATTPTLISDENADEHKDILYSSLFSYPQITQKAYIQSKPLLNSATLDFARQEGVVCIDLAQSIDNIDEYFADDYHLSLSGTEFVADKYAEVLFPMIQE